MNSLNEVAHTDTVCMCSFFMIGDVIFLLCDIKSFSLSLCLSTSLRCMCVPALFRCFLCASGEKRRIPGIVGLIRLRFQANERRSWEKKHVKEREAQKEFALLAELQKLHTNVYGHNDDDDDDDIQ